MNIIKCMTDQGFIVLNHTFQKTIRKIYPNGNGGSGYCAKIGKFIFIVYACNYESIKEEIFIPDCMKEQISDGDIKKIEFMEISDAIKLVDTCKNRHQYVEITIINNTNQEKRIDLTRLRNNLINNSINTSFLIDGYNHFFKSTDPLIPNIILKITTHNDKYIHQGHSGEKIYVFKTGDKSIILDEQSESIMKLDLIGIMTSEMIYMLKKFCMTRLLKFDIVRKIGKTILKGIIINSKSNNAKIRLCNAICSLCAIRPINRQIIDCSDKKNLSGSNSIIKLFDDAFDDYKAYGDNSLIHCFIFDQINLISGHKRIIKQLLDIFNSEDYNNVLIIGLTKNPMYVDDILEGPGRFEIQFDIGKIDSDGMHEIHVNHLNKSKSMETIKNDNMDETEISDDMDETFVNMREYKLENDILKEKISKMENIIETLTTKIDHMNTNNIDIFKHMALIMEKLTNK